MSFQNGIPNVQNPRRIRRPSPTLFREELRSGAYTTYWISGKVVKLKDDLAQEVREAAYGGAGLILDGIHDQRNKALDDAAGVLYRGKLGQQNQPLWLLAPIFDMPSLPTVGRGLKLDAVASAVVGRFQTPSGVAAAFGNEYGQGRTVLLGLDAVASLAADARWPDALAQALAWVTPAPVSAWTPGAWLPVTAAVTNTGADADVQVRMTLPAGSGFIGAKPAQTEGPTGSPPAVLWQFPLAKGDSRTLDVALRVPGAEGSAQLVTSLAARTGTNDFTAHGAPHVLDFSIVTAIGQLPTVQANIATLAVGSNADKQARDKAVAQIDLARQAVAAGQWSAAITALVAAIDQLRGLTTAPAANVSAHRLALDQALREVEWRWFASQGGH